MNILCKSLYVLGIFLMVGCTSQTPAFTANPSPSETPPPSKTPTFTPSPQPPTATPTPSPEPSPLPKLSVCSPLEGISLADLPTTIFNPFAPPCLGSDDPHQGVDFADIDPVYQIALEGRPVQAVVEGIVAGVITDRFPYGNAVLIETSLDQLPAEWLATLQIPTPAPPQEGHSVLTCPQTTLFPESVSGPRSLYILYAHLKTPAQLEPGDMVTCGSTIGAIGNSGNSINPHVHIEMRVGPSQTYFESIAHYDSSASAEEMGNYCLWRVSEVFQLLDPMLLLSQE